MLRRLKKYILILLSVVLISGCGSAKHYTAYTIYPIGYLLNRIGGNRIEAVSIQNRSLVQTAVLNSDYQEVLADSSVLFHIGDLEPYMDLYEEEIKASGIDLNSGDLSVLNCLYEYKRYTPIIVDSKMSFVEGAYYEGEIFDVIDTYDLDPFIWLSPSGMYCMAKDIYDYLSGNYVEQSSYFTENFKQVADDLIALDASYQALASRLIKENKTIKFVSMTGSFGCWQKDFGFQVYPVCLSKYGALPNDAQLEIIKNKIRNDDVRFIAYEPNLSVEMVELMSKLEEELGLKRVTLANISSLTNAQSDSGKDYLSLMYENLSVLESIATSNVTQNTVETVEETETVEEE